jgi:hypothetical protein
MLENEEGLCDPGLLLGALFWLAPLQGLDLHLPVDAGKAASLLQHCLQQDSFFFFFPRFSAIITGASRGERLAGTPVNCYYHYNGSLQRQQPRAHTVCRQAWLSVSLGWCGMTL